MRFVVTGGAGFIGSNIVAHIERRGLGEVAVVDPVRDERWRNISKRKLIALITEPTPFEYLDDCPNDTTLIHMGARTSTADPEVEALIKTNTQLTVDLFNYCRMRRWPFVYASSASVYGISQRQAEADDAGAAPLNPYAWSKLNADNMIRAGATLEADDHLLRVSPKPPLAMWAGLRLFNVYGPGEQHKGEQKSFVTRCFDAIIASQPITVWRGSDAFVRDWVYVDDVARLVCDLLSGTRPHTPPDPFPSGVYNVGTGTAVSFIDVAKACIEASGSITPLEWVAFPTDLNGRYQSYTKADTGRLSAAAPYFQFTPLAEGVAAYWRDYASRKGDARHP